MLDHILSKKWDRINRLQLIYDTIVVDDDFSVELKELLLRKWFISAVAAVAKKDGIFAKGVLVFQSKQSVGKTTWFKSLVPTELKAYFKEGCNLDPTNKDSVKTVISKWFVEFGEMDSTLKRDVARLKAFISSDKDVFRVTYGKKDTKFTRRTVFCGSVNEREFLVDHTGNVRFWCIPVLKLFKLDKIDMQQFWAEIYEIYKSGERWWLEQKEERLLETSNKDHVKSCPYEEAFLGRYKVYTPNDNEGCDSYLYKGAKELLSELGWTNINQGSMNQMSAMLFRLGAIRKAENKKFKVAVLKNSKQIEYF